MTWCRSAVVAVPASEAAHRNIPDCCVTMKECGKKDKEILRAVYLFDFGVACEFLCDVLRARKTEM